MNIIDKVFGTHSERELKRIEPIVKKIESYREAMGKLTDEELRGKTTEFKKRLTEGETLDDLLPEAYATVREAAKHKGGETRKITGDADVLLFPDIHAGNLVYKTLTHLCEVKNGNILTGTAAPVILTSRSDTCETKLYSIALAAVVAEELKKTK